MLHLRAVFALELAPTVVALLLSRVAPALLFPRPDASVSLLKACERLVQRFLTVSALLVALVWFAIFSVAPLDLGADLSGDKWAFWAALHVPAGLFYAFCIVRVAIQRSHDEKAVMGQRAGVGASVEMSVRVLNNTTEQLILLLVSTAAVNATLPLVISRTALPLVIGIWLSARALFLLGYSDANPMGREFGFDLTLLNSISCLLISLWFSL